MTCLYCNTQILDPKYHSEYSWGSVKKCKYCNVEYIIRDDEFVERISIYMSDVAAIIIDIDNNLFLPRIVLASISHSAYKAYDLGQNFDFFAPLDKLKNKVKNIINFI